MCSGPLLDQSADRSPARFGQSVNESAGFTLNSTNNTWDDQVFTYTPAPEDREFMKATWENRCLDGFKGYIYRGYFRWYTGTFAPNLATSFVRSMYWHTFDGGRSFLC